MPTYGDDTYGTPATYSGGSTMQPTSTEVGGYTATRGGAGGGVSVINNAPQMPGVVNDILGGIQILGGTIEAVGAVGSVILTDGADAPAAAAVFAGGVANIVSGVSRITGAQSGQSPYGGQGGPMIVAPDPRVDLYLDVGGHPRFDSPGVTTINNKIDTIFPGGTSINHSICAQIGCCTWDCEAGPTCPSYGFLLQSLYNADRQRLRFGGVRYGPMGVFTLLGTLDLLDTSDLTVPLFPLGLVSEGQSLEGFLNTYSGYSPWVPSTRYYGYFEHDFGVVHERTWVCGMLPKDWEQQSFWRYTPTSGPPSRNIYQDWNKLFALIPVQY